MRLLFYRGVVQGDYKEVQLYSTYLVNTLQCFTFFLEKNLKEWQIYMALNWGHKKQQLHIETIFFYRWLVLISKRTLKFYQDLGVIIFKHSTIIKNIFYINLKSSELINKYSKILSNLVQDIWNRSQHRKCCFFFHQSNLYPCIFQTDIKNTGLSFILIPSLFKYT